MAERPVFLPVEGGARLVREVPVAFRWHPGFAASQKRKNVAALHAAAARHEAVRGMLEAAVYGRARPSSLD